MFDLEIEFEVVGAPILNGYLLVQRLDSRLEFVRIGKITKPDAGVSLWHEAPISILLLRCPTVDTREGR